jgi:Cu-processing system ATP-binding protein
VSSDRSGALDTELCDRFGLATIGRRRLGVLSGGTRQRINAAIAFLFAPPLLILDEPTVGLDPLSAVILRDKIRNQRTGGRTVLLTSHLVGEVEEMADHVVYMLEGRPFFDGSIEDLRRLTAEPKLERAIVRLMEENRSGASGQNTDVRNS